MCNILEKSCSFFGVSYPEKVQTVYQRLSASSVRPLDPLLHHSNRPLEFTPYHSICSDSSLDQRPSTIRSTDSLHSTISDPYSSRLLEQNPIRPSEITTRASFTSLITIHTKRLQGTGSSHPRSYHVVSEQLCIRLCYSKLLVSSVRQNSFVDSRLNTYRIITKLVKSF